MALRFPNLAHLVWRYMRGDDIKEANAAAVARAQAELRAPSGAARPSGGADRPTVDGRGM